MVASLCERVWVGGRGGGGGGRRKGKEDLLASLVGRQVPSMEQEIITRLLRRLWLVVLQGPWTRPSRGLS